MPSLRLDGYFILADLIGVPDLFRRIGPVLRSLIPGQPVDPRIRDLKRAARLTLTTWILIVVPLLLVELTLITPERPDHGQDDRPVSRRPGARPRRGVRPW